MIRAIFALCAFQFTLGIATGLLFGMDAPMLSICVIAACAAPGGVLLGAAIADM